MKKMYYSLKLHRKYLINKITIIGFITILFLIILISFFFLRMETDSFSFVIDKSLIYLNRNLIYQKFSSNYLIILKFIMVISNIFLFGNSFIPQNDEYSSFLVLNKKDIGYYYFLKIFNLIIVSIFFNILISLIMVTSFNTSFPIRFNINYFFNLSLLIILYSNVFGLLSIILVLLFKNYFGLLIPIIIFILREIMEDLLNNNLKNIINIVVPSINNSYSIINYPHQILLIIIFLISGYIIYLRKEFK